ncbi:unnamed protein product [Larinioides sclopetarius]|uniref:FAT domain-containing protein n=1 Tax=Larinioides sclopetarius TaxID=280406 RepID=A0AAV1ZDX7_9ARAC
MTAAIEIICKHLETLKTFQENNTLSGNEGTVSDVIKKIRETYYNFNFKKQDREIANTYLLSNQSGILRFLKAIVFSKDFKDIKKECLKLLDDIIEQSGYLIQDYGSDILAVCILYIKRDVGADLKKSSIVTLSKVLENCHGCQGEKKINIKNLIEDLFFQLSLRSKLTSTVKEEILSIIGVIAHYYPEDFVPYQERMLSIFIQELKAQINSKTKAFDYNIVAGCLQGLKEYLYNFSVLHSEDTENSYFIFDVSRKMISRSEKYRSKTSSVTKAGLQLLASHALQFDLYVFENCVDLYHEVMDWVEHPNREMQKLGRDAIVSVLKVTSEMIAAKFVDDKNYCTKIFKYFMKQFREIFLESENSSRKLQIAVIAYGLFAKPCKLCLSENEVKLMLQNVIQRCEHTFLSDSTDIDGRILDLSSYLEALSSIISVTEHLSENVIMSLEKLTVFQIDKFPKVPSRVHFIVPKVVIRILLSIQPKHELFLNFLTQVVYQGLVKTCSHPIVAEAEALKDKASVNDQQIQKEMESALKIVTYKDYIYLWKSVLNVVQLKELNPLGITLEQRQSLMEAVYDELIRSSLVLVTKLNLSLTQSPTKSQDDQNKEEISSDPLHGVQPNNMTDYYIFINLVDFLRDLLNDTCTELFSKWVFIFGKEIIFLSTRHPYHSGFYKLISLTLSICSKIGFFKEFTYRNENLSIKTENISEEKWRSFQLFSKFVTEVAVRQQQFKDELLASCLGVLLSLPIEIVLRQINVLIPCLESALKLGVSYLPLASAAVSALERWSDNLPLDIMKPHFSQLLPYLNCYLLASTIQDDTLVSNAQMKKNNLKAAHKMSTKSVRRSNQNALDAVLDDPALLKIQQKIVCFLGRLGEHNVALLEKAYENLDEVAIAWDSHYRNHLKYSVPFQDIKPDIYFDDFLPHIMEIATKSSIRQAKVAACEALHSLVLFMIGRGSLLPDDLQTKYSMEGLYKKLFPGLLELACDVEQVTKQLFQPLVFQIIHWFTCNRVSKSPETSVILLCLWDGVTNNQNAALRDFSALGLREFFLWSIKQSPSGKQKQTENLLSKLHSFSLHPNAFKRLGAALTFNNIYRILREEESLVKKFTIQLLVQFVDSLAIAHTDDVSLGTQKQCVIALDHIQRIIVNKQKLFFKTEESRKKPECLEEATLQCTVLWLLRQCGCVQIECRHKCMELVEKLAPFIPGSKSTSSYLLTYNNLGKNIFEDVFENVLKNFSISGLHNQMTFKCICFWLEALQTSMDCYQWAFSKQFLLQNELHGVKYSSMLSSVKIYKIIEYYIENIIKESLPSIMSRSKRDQSELFTPEEIFKFNKLKCTVLVRLFTFIMSVFSTDAKWFNEQFVKILWNSSLWEIIIISAVDPSSLGFDVTDPEVALKLPLEVATVIREFSEKSEFQNFCLKYLNQKDRYNLLKFLPISLQDFNHNYMQIIQLLKGYEILITNGFEASKFFLDTHEVISNLLESVWNDSIEINVTTLKKRTLPPIAFRLAETILLVSYNLGLKVDELSLRLLNAHVLSGNSNVHSEKGLFIFNIFAESICTFVAKTPDIFVKTLVNFLNKTTFTEISILIKFIDFVACSSILRKSYGKDVIKAYLLYWNDINEWWECHPDTDSKYSVLSIMTKMLLIDSEVAVNKTGFYSMSLFSTFVNLLKKQNNELSFIDSTLELLPFFIEDTVDIETLKFCIEEIRAVHFPLQSTELQIGSSAYHTYISALKRLLSSLSLTGCDFLLQFLTTFFCKEHSHPLEAEFQRSIIQMIRRKDPCHHQKFADIVFEMLLKQQKLDPEGILAIVDKILLVILLNIDVTPLMNFFSSCVKVLLGNIKENIALVTPEKNVFLAKKIACFKLLELMYQNLSKDVLHSKDSQIVESFLGQKPTQGNELSSEIIKLSLEFKRISYETEPEYKELRRKLNCAKYNTLMAVVSCTQNELKFYNAFLFKENPTKNELIWERIVDGENKLVFEMEMDPSISRKKKFVAIRHNIRNESHENDDEIDSYDVPSSLNLFGSENLGLSSLAEDVSKFVFSTNEPLFSLRHENIEEVSNMKSKKSSIEKKYKGNYIVLEEDELNSHDSMGALCQLLQQMKSRGLIPEEQTDCIPLWLNCIVQSLQAGMLSENVRLFLGRIIINNAEILRPYAKFLMEPLLDLVILGIAGFSLNYYILDIIITLLSWAPVAVPEGNGILKANEVLKFLIRNCEHSRREIFRNNLEVIKTLLECWKNGLEIPYNLIYEKMNDFTPENKRNVFGIQLLGVVLSCDFLPFNCQDIASAQSYFSILLKNLSHKYKEVYGSAAEVTSLALKNILKDEVDVAKNPYFIKVEQQLENLKNKDEEKFLYCLNKIHIDCPAVADKFIPRLLFLYPRVYSSFKNYILQVLCSRINHIENGYQELKVIGLFEDLEKREEISQKLLLQTLEKLIPVLSCDNILQVLPGIVNIHGQPSVANRLALYQILFLLFEKFSDSAGAKEKEITRYAQETLLIGLADPDPSIRLTVDNFWSNEKRLPSGTKERLLALMRNMFSPVTEESFLQYATFLLLERTSHSPDFKRKVFDHPLSQCNFQAYQIQTSWRKRHLAMSPLFTESVSSTFSSLMSLDSYALGTYGHDPKIKVTQQNLAFTETMEIDEDLRKQGTYNWLTERSDTFTTQDFSFDSGYGTASFLSKSLLIANQNDAKQSDKDLSWIKQTKKSDEKKERKSLSWLLKRRFYKDKNNDSDAFAQQELKRQDRRMELRKEQQSKRDAQVVMYRQYRIGELPDIEISNSEIIKPIQALAMNDGVIAKLLFKSLLIAVCNYVQNELPEYLETFNGEIGSCFDKILQNSYLYTPNVMSFCLETLNQVQDVKFDVETVFNACIGSNQQSIGILLLETKILKGFNSEPAQKKRRANKHALSEESNHWMKLAELYKSIESYDVVNGIFSLTMGEKEENKKALNFEISGQYFKAVLLYNKLYDNTSDEHDQGEKDFWDKSILYCMNKLSKWSDLETTVISRFTNPESPDLQVIWEDQYMKENYLPYLIRSKMKQLLIGKPDQSILTFFDLAREDEEKKIHLEAHYSEELALLYILQDRFDIARQYSSACLNRFLKEWQNLSPLAVEVQHACLQKLLKYVELAEFLDLMKRNKYVNAPSIISCLKTWQTRFPNTVDPVDIWDDVIGNRHLYMKKLQKMIEESDAKIDQDDSCQIGSEHLDDCDYKKHILDTSVLMKLKFAEDCADQKNFPVAVSTLKSIYVVSKALDSSLWSKFIEAYCSINNRRVLFESERKLSIVLESWKQLGELGKRCGQSVSQMKLLSHTLEILAVMLIKDEIAIRDLTDKEKEMISVISEKKTNKTDMISEILNKSFLCLKNVIKTPAELTKQNYEKDIHKKDIASAHMELANFCNRYLIDESVHGFSPYNIPSFSEFSQVLTASLLDALKFGSKDSLLLFPRLLQVIETYPSCLPIFQMKTSEMPCWLFIGWIDQMLAILDKPEGKAVHVIIENIASTYPDAIIYAFHLSYSSYDFTNLKDAEVNQNFVQKIKCILEKQTLISDFVDALGHLSVPYVIFKEYMAEIEGLVNSNAEKVKIKDCFTKMLKVLFFDKTELETRRIPVGPVQKKFAEEFRPKVLDVCGIDGSKLLGKSGIQIWQKLPYKFLF